MNARRMLMMILIAAAVCLVGAGVGESATLTVDDSGGANYTNIQAAIDDASSGDEIQVNSGTYYENVLVNKQLILRGIDAGSGLPVVDAMQTDTAINLTADGTTLNGFIVTNATFEGQCGIFVLSDNNAISNNYVYSNAHGIVITSNNNTLINNTANSNSYSGFYLANESDNNRLINNIADSNEIGFLIESSIGNNLTNNTANSNNVTGITMISKSDYNTINKNIISDNSIGIFLIDSSQNILDNNTANLNEIGICIESSIENDLTSNTANLNNITGIALEEADNNTIANNSVKFNYVDGIFLGNSSDNVFTGNIVNENDDFGIILLLSYNNTIIENNVLDKVNSSILLTSSSNNLIYHNNLGSGYDDTGTNLWDNDYPSGGNYWIDYTGMDEDNDGIGDTPYNISGGAGAQDRYPLMQPYNQITSGSSGGGGGSDSELRIRGPTYSGTDLDTIIGYSNSDFIEMNAANFPGFYYDLDEDIATESLVIKGGDFVSDRTIESGGVVYTTTIANIDYESSNLAGTYPILALFGEKYVPIRDDDAGKLAKLIIDDDTNHTLTDEPLDLGGGFALTAKQLDVEDDKVWMELSKDGEFVEDELVDLTAGEANWTYERDGVAGEDDVMVFIVHVTDVFQGTVDSLAVVKGIWLIDYTDILEIETGNEFGELEVTTVGTSLVLSNSGPVSLTAGSTVDIADDLKFKVAEDPDYLRFYLMKEFTEPGTYEVRGTVASGSSAQSWDYSSFSGFFYDLDDDVQTESLQVRAVSTRTIAEDDLVYNTTIANVNYESSNLGGTYQVLCLFGEKYVPISYDDAGKLAKLLIDDDTNYSLKTGEPLDLGSGFTLTAKAIDVGGDKVLMELSKDGEFVKDEVVDISAGAATWTYERDDVAGEDDITVLIVHVTDILDDENLTIVEGLWLIDYEDILEIEPSDEFGELEVYSISDSIVLKNTGSITLTADSTVDIADGLKFKVADDTYTLRYCPFVEVTIEGLSITDFSPWDSTPESVEGDLQEFDIMTNQVCNVTWMIDDIVVKTDTSVTLSSYENSSASAGSHNVKATAQNGTEIKTMAWTWTVTSVTVPAPKITLLDPSSSSVSNYVGDSRTFTVIVDQVADVTWILDGTTLYTNVTTQTASYYNSSAQLGSHNLTVFAENSNGTDQKEWTWTVISVPAPGPVITLLEPSSSSVSDYVGISRTFTVDVSQIANVTWILDGTMLHTNESVQEASYYFSSAELGVHNLTVMAQNEIGMDQKCWNWMIRNITAGIELYPGWHFISVPCELCNPGVDHVLECVTYDALTCYNTETCLWETVSAIEPLKGYWIHIPEDCGTQVIPEEVLEPAVTPYTQATQIFEGWNAIGCCESADGLSAELSLSCIDDCYTCIFGPWDPVTMSYEYFGHNGESGLISGRHIGTDVFGMEKYQGYWVYATSDTVLVERETI